MFVGWKHKNIIDYHYNRSILANWRPDYYRTVPNHISSQTITYEVEYIPLKMKFLLTFVYAFNTKEEKRHCSPLWCFFIKTIVLLGFYLEISIIFFTRRIE